MKRILTASLILMGALTSKVFAVQDQWGSERPAIWRSSRTCVAENFLLLATGTIHLHAVIVESPTVNSESFMSIYNSSSPASATGNLNIDTAIFTPTVMIMRAITAAAADDVMQLQNIQFPSRTEWDIQLTSGAVINKIGAACTNVLWDFLSTRDAREQAHIVPYKP